MTAAQVTRTREIEDASNLYLVHPLSSVFVRIFAKLGIHPNAVSLAGMSCGALAALFYYHYGAWEMATAGFLSLFAWHVFDGADGQLARYTGKTSELGKVLDGVCDHVAYTLVYVSFAIALTPVHGIWVWVFAVLAGAAHIAQSSAYEYQRHAYDYWVHGKGDRAPLLPGAASNGSTATHGLSSAYHAYLWTQRRVSAVDGALQRALAHVSDTLSPARVAAHYRAVNLPAVKHWSWLNANNRTLAIYLAALAGDPIYYFIFEAVALSAVLFALVHMQRRRNRELKHRLAGEISAAPAVPPSDN